MKWEGGSELGGAAELLAAAAARALPSVFSCRK